jgi:AcrR family transcriptional regulator
MVFMSRRAKEKAGLPRPPWSTAKEPERAALSREALTAAALKIVDTEGLDALSMRRLAEEVGAVPSALYAHVSGKPELLQMMIDQVSGEVALPDPSKGQWTAQLKNLMRAMHRSLSQHRDLAGANLGNIPTGHNALKVTESMITLLRAGGLSRQAAAYATDLLPMYVTASAYEGSIFRAKLEKEPEYFEKLAKYMRALPADHFPVSSDLVEEMLAHEEPHDARFEFGLEVIMAGLEALAAKKSKKRRSL